VTKREIAIGRAKIAGYNGDAAEFTRVIIESRVKREALLLAWRLGEVMKSRGVPCGYSECKLNFAAGDG
jgi:hypothetical protein